VDADIK